MSNPEACETPAGTDEGAANGTLRGTAAHGPGQSARPVRLFGGIPMSSVVALARVLLAATFIVSGLAKLITPAGTRRALTELRVPARMAAPLSWSIPLVEGVLAGALLTQRTGRWAAASAALFLTVVSVPVARALRRGEHPGCNCFGTLSRSRASSHSLARNAALAAIAVLGRGAERERRWRYRLKRFDERHRLFPGRRRCPGSLGDLAAGPPEPETGAASAPPRRGRGARAVPTPAFAPAVWYTGARVRPAAPRRREAVPPGPPGSRSSRCSPGFRRPRLRWLPTGD